ncbi:MAG: hypothetical protein ACR2JY_04270 [Chloroflexota bacterium]
MSEIYAILRARAHIAAHNPTPDAPPECRRNEKGCPPSPAKLTVDSPKEGTFQNASTEYTV